MGCREDLLDAFDVEDAEAGDLVARRKVRVSCGQEVKDLLGRVEAWIAKLKEPISAVDLVVFTC